MNEGTFERRVSLAVSCSAEPVPSDPARGTALLTLRFPNSRCPLSVSNPHRKISPPDRQEARKLFVHISYELTVGQVCGRVFPKEYREPTLFPIDGETVAQRLRAYDSGKAYGSPRLWVRDSGAARLVASLSSHVADKSALAGGGRPLLLPTEPAPQRSPEHETRLLPLWMVQEQDGSGSVFITQPQKSQPLGRGHPGGWLAHLGPPGSGMMWKGFSFSEHAYPWFPSENRENEKVGRGGWTEEN